MRRRRKSADMELILKNGKVEIKSFICPTNAHINCFKMLKFTLKIAINARTCFGLTKPSSWSLRCVIRGAFIAIFNVNFNILKQFKCALFGQIKELVTSKCTVQL